MKPMPESDSELTRSLSLIAAISIVMGTVIGTGVFLKAAPMIQEVGTPTLVLAAWAIAGLLSLAGALSYAELGTMFPNAGGEYVYLRKAYGEGSPSGDIPAFLYGWMQIIVGQTGTIAALGIACATFLSVFLPIDIVWVKHTFRLFESDLPWQFGLKQVVAIILILIFSSINCLSIVFGGRVQSVLTAAKIVGIATILVGVFFFSKTATWANLATPSGTAQWAGLKTFGAAMIAALWAYNGWNLLPMAAGKIRDPSKNVKRALLIGMVLIFVIYMLVNLAYFYALPVQEVLTSYSDEYNEAVPVAAKASESFLGSSGANLISVIFIISAMGALNGGILASAHIPFAMARDGLFFSRVSALGKGADTPVWAIALQAVWASVLALSGTFDQLTNLVVFVYWVFYGLTTISVFVLRRKLPNHPRPYRTLGYPVVPLLFVFVAAWLVINSLLTSPIGSTMGLVLVGLGLPLYFYFRRKHQHTPTK